MNTENASGKRLLDPVGGDEVPKIDDAVAVGEDLRFQERWWTFETSVWCVFIAILIANALGVFGAGWLAHTTVQAPETAMQVHYDRIARTGTPTLLTIHFQPDAASNGEVRLAVSDSVTKKLGAQRVIPQPERSAIVAGGLEYTFPAGATPGTVDFALQPSAPGLYTFQVQVVGKTAVQRRVLVMP